MCVSREVQWKEILKIIIVCVLTESREKQWKEIQEIINVQLTDSRHRERNHSVSLET
jgi:hypothetical protein